MRILIDTQIFLWLFLYPERIKPDTESLLKNTAHQVFLSSVSIWEIAIKYGIGKLQLPDKPEIFVPDRAKKAGFAFLPMTHKHALEIAYLPLHHKDPFDRLLIAQAKFEGLTLLTTDPIFQKYTTDLIDAEIYKEPVN